MEPEADAHLPPAEVDRKQLRTVLSRFRAISQARLERVRAMLGERARQVVDLLPLLLHANHPALPGYVSQQTPCGIGGYRPAPEVLALARRLARSFDHRAAPAAEPGVDAVYLMGSSGTLGHSDGSDLDVWICYPESLSPEALALLQRKAELIAAWARESGLDAHLFLMNGAKFRRGQREPLTGENCGSAQHYLLLDEFYRTGILLAGRIPAWWLVPPAAEPGHDAWVAGLTSRHHVREHEIVDFGGIHAVPAGEFVGAGIWQLYKAIDSPYKSVLKLLLFELYAAELPSAECLSAGYKRAVYAGVTDIDELDPYLMIHRRLEEHLLRSGQPERLELVRRCLYYKAGKKLSRAPQGGTPSWQRLLMARVVAGWGWDRAKLALLDARAEWKIQELAAERNALVRELVCSYRFLAELARRTEVASSIEARELSVLGRKLYAAYERRAGKIENLDPGGSTDASEQELGICAQPGAEGPAGPLWAAWPGLPAGRGLPEGRPLRQAACLSELLGWCVVNGVIGERTRIGVREAIDGLRHAEVDGMVRELRALVQEARAARAAGDEAFAAPARPVTLLVFANVAADPLASVREAGVERVSSRTDSLGYSAMRENLVLNVETVMANSWGEIVAARYAGEEGLLRCLRDFLPIAPRAGGRGAGPRVRIRSFCASRAGAIESRLAELFADLAEGFRAAAHGQGARYVLAVGHRLWLLQDDGGQGGAQVAATPAELLGMLGEPLPRWMPLAIDRYALRGTALPLVASLMEPGQVSVFVEREAEGLRLLVADERGALHESRVPAAPEQASLGALALFLQSVRYRQNGAAPGVAPERPPRFFRIARAHLRGEYAAQPLAVPAPRTSEALHVQAIVEHDGAGGVAWTVWCEGSAFSQRELGPDFAAALAARIRAHRAGGAPYPLYITDLDLSAIEPPGAPLATVGYLRRREAVEALLNAALGGP